MRVIAERTGDRIYVRVPFSGDNVEVCKSIPGARWSKRAKAWTYPLDLETGRRLRESWGHADLVLGPELTKWGQDQVVVEKKLIAHSNVKDIDVMKVVDLPRVRKRCPGMWEAMSNRPYQPVASYYMMVAKQCLNGDQPGIGKTIETLGALIEGKVRGPILVLAPRTSVRSVWEPEIDKWLETLKDDWSLTVAVGSKAKIERAYAEHKQLCEDYPTAMNFLVVNAEQARIVRDVVCPTGKCSGDEDWCPDIALHKNKSTVRKPYLHQIKWSAIIGDETHKWLIRTRGKNASQVGYGFTRLQTNETDVRYALTGTPLRGKKHNLFGTLNWLRRKVYTSKWRWIETYFHIFDDTYSRVIGDLKREEEEAFHRSLQSIMIRRTKDELRKINPAWMPPEKEYHDIWVDMEGTQAKHYQAMLDYAAAELEGGRLQATGILAELTRLKQFALCDHKMENGKLVPIGTGGKFSWLLQFLDDRGIETKSPGSKSKWGDLSDDVQKVIVASQFTSVLNIWKELLESKGIRVLMITGETKEPEVVTQTFQNNDDYRLVLINTNAGGVSITLDAADDVVIMDETWVPDEQEQVEDRAHRASNIEHHVNCWYVRTRDTVEEEIAETNMGKAKSNHIVLDAKRGLKFAKERFGTAHKKEKAK